MKLAVCTKFQVNRMNYIESRRGEGGSDWLLPPSPPSLPPSPPSPPSRLRVTIFTRRLLGLTSCLFSYFSVPLKVHPHPASCLSAVHRCPVLCSSAMHIGISKLADFKWWHCHRWEQMVPSALVCRTFLFPSWLSWPDLVTHSPSSHSSSACKTISLRTSWLRLQSATAKWELNDHQLRGIKRNARAMPTTTLLSSICCRGLRPWAYNRFSFPCHSWEQKGFRSVSYPREQQCVSN